VTEPEIKEQLLDGAQQCQKALELLVSQGMVGLVDACDCVMLLRRFINEAVKLIEGK